jgi:hypothetical protein
VGLIVITRDDRPPRYRCLACRTMFREGEETAYERHVVACSAQHDEELRADSVRTRMPGLFDPFVSGDVEFGRWVRANRGLLLEGRRKL